MSSAQECNKQGQSCHNRLLALVILHPSKVD
jgi:hypothetical protein